MPREKWTDERLDDLQGEMHRGFAETKAEMRNGFANTKAEIADTKAEMRAGFAETKAEIRELRDRFDRLQQTLIGGFFVLIAAVIGSNAF